MCTLPRTKMRDVNNCSKMGQNICGNLPVQGNWSRSYLPQKAGEDGTEKTGTAGILYEEQWYPPTSYILSKRQEIHSLEKQVTGHHAKQKSEKDAHWNNGNWVQVPIPCTGTLGTLLYLVLTSPATTFQVKD